MEATELRLQAQDLNQQALLLVQTGHLEEAEDRCGQAIQLDPMLMDSYKNLGDIALSKEKFEDAKNYYKKALLIEKSPIVYFQYGSACFLNDQPHEGLEYYNLALTAGYVSEDMYFFMAMAYDHMNDQSMALRYVQKAIMLNPSRPDFKAKKIDLLLQMGRKEEAEKVIDDILRTDPELYEGYHQKIMILLGSGRIEEAVRFSGEAIEKFPEDVDLLFDHARALLQAQRHQDAKRVITTAKKMEYFEESKAKFCFLEAQIHSEQGDLDEAIKSCKECIALEKGFYSEVRFMLINLFLLTQKFENALKEADSILNHNAQDTYYLAALYYKPFCLKMLDRKSEAEHHYKEAISLYRLKTLKNPETGEAYLYRAMCLKDLGMYEDALNMLELMEQIVPQVAEVYTIKAEIYQEIGQKDLRRNALEKAFLIKPELKQIVQGEV